MVGITANQSQMANAQLPVVHSMQLRHNVVPGAITMPHHILPSILRRRIRSSCAVAAGKNDLLSTKATILRMEEELRRLQASLDLALNPDEAEACTDCARDQASVIPVEPGPIAAASADTAAAGTLADDRLLGLLPEKESRVDDGSLYSAAPPDKTEAATPVLAEDQGTPLANEARVAHEVPETPTGISDQPLETTAGGGEPADVFIPELSYVPEGVEPSVPDAAFETADAAAAAAAEGAPVMPPDLYYVPEGAINGDVEAMVPSEAAGETAGAAASAAEGAPVMPPELYFMPEGVYPSSSDAAGETANAAATAAEGAPVMPPELYFVPEGSMNGEPEAMVPSEASEDIRNGLSSMQQAVEVQTPDVYFVPEGNIAGSPDDLTAPNASLSEIAASLDKALQDSEVLPPDLYFVPEGTVEGANGGQPDIAGQVTEEVVHNAVAKMKSLLTTVTSDEALAAAAGGKPDVAGQASEAAFHEAVAKMEALLATFPDMELSSGVVSPAWPSLLSTLQSAMSSLSSTTADTSPNQLQYALETLKKVQAELQDPSKLPYWAPDGATGESPATPDVAPSSQYWMPEGNFEGAPAGVEISLEALQDDVSRNRYWVPGGVEGTAAAQPTPSPLDVQDPSSTYWLPDSRLDSGQVPPKLPVSDAAVTDDGMSAVQSAIKDLVDAMDLPASDAADVIKLVDKPPVPVESIVPAESVDQVVSAVNSLKDSVEGDSGTRAFLSSIHSLGDALAEQFRDMSLAGSVPLLGRVLAYVLAAAGVIYLMKETIPNGQGRPPADSPIEPVVLDGKEGQETKHSKSSGVNVSAAATEIVDKPNEVSEWVAPKSSDLSAISYQGSDIDVPTSSLSSSGSVDEPSLVLPWMMDDPSGWGAQPDVAEAEEVALNVHLPNANLTPVPQTASGRAESPAPAQRTAISADSEEAATNDELRARDIDVLAERRRAASEEISVDRALIKDKLWWVVRGLGHTAAIVPGGEEVRGDIDILISKLEELTPLETPLNIQANAEEFAYMKAKSKAHPHLLGEWRLEYASNDQVVEKNIMQQALQLAEAIPGFGVGDVSQQLRNDLESDNLLTENTAVFGLGPFGSWQIRVSGIWTDNGGGVCAKASFKSFSVRPVKILGLSADALPEVRVAVPSELQAEVEWCTTYCDKDFRVGRGTAGNLFVFRKDPNGSTARRLAM